MVQGEEDGRTCTAIHHPLAFPVCDVYLSIKSTQHRTYLILKWWPTELSIRIIVAVPEHGNACQDSHSDSARCIEVHVEETPDALVKNTEAVNDSGIMNIARNPSIAKSAK